MELRRKFALFATPLVGCLLVSGIALSAAPVAAHQQEASTPPRVEVKVRVIEAQVDAAGKSVEHVLQSPSFLAQNDTEGKVTIGGDLDKVEIVAKPHVAVDGRIVVAISYSEEKQSATKPVTVHTTKLETTRSLKPDTFVRMNGVADTQDKQVMEALIHNKPAPAIGKPYHVIYIEASARVVPPPAPGSTP